MSKASEASTRMNEQMIRIERFDRKELFKVLTNNHRPIHNRNIRPLSIRSSVLQSSDVFLEQQGNETDVRVS